MMKYIKLIVLIISLAPTAWSADQVGWTSWVQLASRPAVSNINVPAGGSYMMMAGPDDLDSADEVTPELQALADALGRNPVRIYEWVKNNIDYVPYSGLKRGAQLTYLEKSGNDFDTCALLVALLRASGQNNVKYKFGSLWFPLERVDGQDAVNWLSAEKEYVRDVLVWSGSNYPGLPDISYDQNVGMTRVRKPHLWVSLTVGTNTYTLDPSFKSYRKGDPVALVDANIAGYSRSELLLAAGTSNSQPDRYLMGSAGLASFRAKLADYTSRLVAYSKNSAHDKGVAQLIGTRELDVGVIQNLPVGFINGVEEDNSFSPVEWDEIPKAYGVHLIVAIGPDSGQTINHTIYLSDLKGEKLNLWFNSNRLARLYVGDSESALVEEPDGAWKNSDAPIRYWIRFPNPLGNLDNRGVPLDRNGNYVILYGFDSTSGRLQSRLKKQAALVDAGAAPEGMPLRSENLYIIGLQHIVQSNAFYSIMEAQSNHMNHLGSVVGVIGYASGAPYLDLPMRIMLIAPRNSAAVALNKMLLANSYWGSAMEHIALEQTNPSPCVSTIKMVNYAVENNHPIFLANSSNYNAVVSQLDNYQEPYIDVVGVHRAVVQNNGKALLIQNQRMEFGQFKGNGYMLMQSYQGAIGIRMGITGGLDGGFSTRPNNLHDTPFSHHWSSSPTISSLTPPIQHPTYFGDPVDASNGSFYKEDVDLSIGDGSPHGLTLSRQYSSSRNLMDPAKLGNGWTHSYHIKLSYRHPNDMDIKRAGLAEVAPLVITCRVILDFVDPEGAALDWVLPAVASSWAGDQMINSRASITMGPKGIEFIKLPDGSFAAPAGVAATLTKQSDGKHVLKFRKGLEIKFKSLDAPNAAGRFESISDNNNSSGTTYSLNAIYDEDLLDVVSDSYGRWLDFEYTAGRLSRVSDSTGREVKYSTTATYFEVEDVMGYKSKFYKNGSHLITGLEDALARTVITFEYDSENRVCAQEMFGDSAYRWEYGFTHGFAREKDPAGFSKYTYFDSRGRKIVAIDQSGARSDWVYDGSDRIAGTVSGEGEEIYIKYDRNHEIVWMKNSSGDERNIQPSSDDSSTDSVEESFEGRATVTEYTNYHKPKVVTHPGDIEATYDYDGRGRISEVHPASFASGKKIFYSYEDDGYTKRVTATYPDSTKEIADYDSRGDLTSSISRRGAKTTYEYNLARQRTKITRWPGSYSASSPRDSEPPLEGCIVTEMDYDAVGNLSVAIDADGNRSEYDYDSQGNLLSITGPDGQIVSTYTYNKRNLLDQSFDGIGSPTVYSYNPNQRLSSVTDPLLRTKSTEYDDDGRIRKVKSDLGYETEIEYNVANYETVTIDPLDNRSVHTTDKDGRIKKFKNRLNHEYVWIYDDQNRKVTTKTPLLKTTETVVNSRGLTESVKEPSAQITSFDEFDDEGRVKKITDGDSVETSYTYLADGSLRTVTEGENSSTRTYDEFGRLREYNNDNGDTIGYSYYPSGKLKRITYPGGAFWVEYAYDEYGRMATVADSGNRITSYSYDPVGNIKRIDRSNETYRLFTYDAAGQVVQIEERKPNDDVIWFQAFKYDNDGRPSWSFTSPAPQPYASSTDSYVYNADNKISAFNGLSIVHDDDGNMTSGPSANDPTGIYTYVYDSRNRLTSMGGVTYGYSVDGHRVMVGGTRYVVDPSADLNKVLMRKSNGQDTYYVWGLGLAYEVTGGEAKYYHSNQLGNTIAISSQAAVVTDRIEYESFGRISHRVGATDTPFLVHGAFGVMSDPNGLVYMKSRYYNPALKRFVNADPIGFKGGSNLYAFAGNSPLLFLDPTGHEAAGRFRNAVAGASGGILGGAIGGAVSGALIGVAGGGVGAIPGAFVGAIAGALNGAFGGAISGALADPQSNSNDISWGASVDAAIWSPISSFGAIGSLTKPIAKTYTVYQSINPATKQTQYIGITSDLQLRAAAHLAGRNGSGTKMVIREIDGLVGLTKAEARAVEQTLIDTHGLSKNGGTLLNKINSISPTNDPVYYMDSILLGIDLLKDAGHLGF